MHLFPDLYIIYRQQVYNYDILHSHSLMNLKQEADHYSQGPLLLNFNSPKYLPNSSN